MSASYFQAAIPEPFRILGLRLRPFSLGHYLLLRRFDNAFVSETSTTATREAVIFAVLVCSMKYEEFLEFIEKPNFLKDVQKWGKKVGIFDLKQKAALLQDYISRGSEEPKFVDTSENTGAPSTAHWSQGLIIALTSQCGYARTEVLNMSLSQALADWMRYAEAQGMVSIVSDEQIEQGKKNAEILAKAFGSGVSDGA